MSVAKQCIGQLNIWDLASFWDLPKEPEEEELPSLEKAVSILEEHFGIKFEIKQFEWDREIEEDTNPNVYVFKKKKIKIEIDESHYIIGNQERFIGVDIENREHGYSGCSFPCDSMERLIDSIERNVPNIYELGKSKNSRHS